MFHDHLIAHHCNRLKREFYKEEEKKRKTLVFLISLKLCQWNFRHLDDISAKKMSDNHLILLSLSISKMSSIPVDVFTLVSISAVCFFFSLLFILIQCTSSNKHYRSISSMCHLHPYIYKSLVDVCISFSLTSQ